MGKTEAYLPSLPTYVCGRGRGREMDKWPGSRRHLGPTALQFDMGEPRHADVPPYTPTPRSGHAMELDGAVFELSLSPASSSFSGSDMNLETTISSRSSTSTPPQKFRTEQSPLDVPNAIKNILCARRTLTLNNTYSNIWYYRECTTPLIYRYDDRPRLGESEDRSKIPIAPLLVSPGASDPAWLRPFFLGSPSHNPKVRQFFARRLVESKVDSDHWNDADLEKLAETFVLRATDFYADEFDPLVEFALDVSRHFKKSLATGDESENRFSQRLEHEIGNIFLFCWKQDCQYSVNSSTAQDPRYVEAALSLAKLLGDLYRVGLVHLHVIVIATRTLYTNLVSIQHLEALRHLIIHAGPQAWDDSWPFKQIHMDAILVIVSSAMGEYPLQDYFPTRLRKPGAIDWYKDIKRFFEGLEGSPPPNY